MKTGETRAIPSPRMPLRFASALALGAMVALSACSGTKTMPETGSAALAAEKQRADAAEEALEELRVSLATAQGALGSGTTAQQRSAARTAIGDALGELREVRKTLDEQPASGAKTAAKDALAAVVTALGAVDAALAATTESGMVSGAGVVVLAGMHTTLDRAQAAIDDAQAKLKAAFEANPSGALRSTLSQAQALLTTAQVSLVPQLRQELTQAEGDAAAQRARAGTAEIARDEQKARADAAQAARDREKARADAAETARDEARSELETARTAQEATEAERDEARAERDALRDEHVHPPLFRSTRGPRDLGATITITRTARTVPNTAGDEWVANPDKLDIATDAVPWAAGRTLTSRAGNEEFPMRAITFRGDIRQGSQRGKTGADADNDGRYPIIQGPGNTLGNANDHTKNAVISSIQFSEDGGLTLEVGGPGTVLNEFQWDIRATEADGPDGIPGDGGATTSTTATAYHVAMFRRAGETPPSVGDTLTQAQADKLTGWAADNCSGVTFPCWDGNMRDLTIDFGKPSPDPDGESGYHWASKIPSSEDQPEPVVADAMHRWAKPKVENFVASERGAGEYRGEYRMWLSNHAGLDTGATDAESDDSHRYLRYAAYGLFTFTDYLTSNVRPARMQGFHFGYDAFADAAGMRTTDLDTPITATFAGRASAMVMEPHSDRSQVERLIRVRGDITLNATIGGANTITGAISNFETPAGGGWGPYVPLRDEVRLTNGTIAAGGSYEGDADVEGGSGHLWDPGKFGGNFYGNRGGPDLETAGWWYLTARGYTPDARSLTGAAARDDPGRPDFRYSGAFGSFGAACTEGCAD